ncbi:MAG TPA: DNA-binding domain-containing protein [Caulobacteraceae bacterium]|jgi:hypothetical protein
MAELAVLQAEMAEALLAGRFEAMAAWLKPGPIEAEEALSVHRGTAIGGLANALRLSHPTVGALVGDDFFDQAARAFVQMAPPSSAWLAGYGEGFGDFLAAYPLAGDLPYLADVARFDFALDAVGQAEAGLDGPVLDLGETAVTLDASLRLLALDHPADAVRDALAEDEDRLARLDMSPRRRTLALWRLPHGVGLRALSPVSAALVQALIEGEDLSEFDAPEQDLAVLSAEVLCAPFARLSLRQAP